MKPGAALSIVALLACERAAPPAQADEPQAQASEAARRDAGRRLDEGRRTAIVEAAARVAPGVVSVNVVRRERQLPRSPFDFFFVPRGYDREVKGLGSGFIVSADGIVITNQHVVEGAEEIVVTIRDGSDYPARLLGEDPLTDIAVLKVDARGLPAVPVGRSSDLMIGEWVVAIGNPYAYLLGNSEPSVTAGVVSAVGRNLLPSGDQPGVYVGMIQTDASVNPGNSGGPLVNAVGEVVGVNSSIFSNTGGSIGIGFAIPIERALRVARELERHGTVRRAWTGLEVAGAEELREWKQSGGLRVTRVAEGGPADRAGLAAGDVLVRADGRELRTFLDWEAVRLDVGPGDTLSLRLRRSGRERPAVLVVEDLPTSRAPRVSALGDMELVTVTPAVQQERGIGRPRGALIVTIGDETRVATGLAVGDVILQVNRVTIETAEDARRALRGAAGGSALRVYFERGQQLGYSDFYVR
ncbi:MAG: trypsin-like peptidase domain-containing protein [Gemmatimonadetes bacterium]|nr:trypsin-like peptidase domain-containing protein [Gemmatimonadota bacterium]